MDVIAKASFEITSKADAYEWKGHGVKLCIHQDSIPADCLHCRMELKASLSGQYTFPAGCKLVSGIYWIYCPVKFSKLLTLELQHCSNEREKLTFVRAECTQKQLPYRFRRWDGGVFSKHSSYGSISLPRFSGWGIVQWLTSLISPQSEDQQSECEVSECQLSESPPRESLSPDSQQPEHEGQRTENLQSEGQHFLESKHPENQQSMYEVTDIQHCEHQQLESQQSESQHFERQQPEGQQHEIPRYSAQVYYATTVLKTWKVLFTIRCRRGLDLEDTVGCNCTLSYILCFCYL